jgi:ubiquinone/menaquinone biosynthesis C-methylase UbiE
VSHTPIASGKSSYNNIDSKILFVELNLKDDTIFLDVACGIGLYSLAAVEFVKDKGNIYAVDLWEDGIKSLLNEVSIRQIKNLHASIADVSKKIPVGKNEVDVCLMATVLHDLIEDKTDIGTLNEVCRVIKPDGLLAIIEFKKIEGPPGPPVKIRINPNEVKEILSNYGFKQQKTMEIGQYHYLSIFINAKN